MSALVFECKLPGMLTTVQDGGRWGYQGEGMPVAGAMDLQAFRMGNILAGNDENTAALEVTIMGPSLSILEGETIIAVTGADLGFQVNGSEAPMWTAVPVGAGDTISFSGPKKGCRAYICFSGGVDVPVVMESRSTYTRGVVGGFQGRALKKGDVLRCGEPFGLWRKCEGLACPEELRPSYGQKDPLRVVAPGPQEEYFTEKGIETFYAGEYKVSPSADRMGYRMEGPVIEHRDAADIISDAIPLGAVQVPGHGQPIVMLADRQTTGGYTKIGVVCAPDLAALAQRMPGMEVRFVKITLDEALNLVREEAQKRDEMRRLRAKWRSAGEDPAGLLPKEEAFPSRGEALLRVDGREHRISWEEIREVE